MVFPLAAVHALVPPGVPMPYGLIALALVGGLAAPVMLCGLVFLCLGAWMAANSLRVSANPARVMAVRRVCGFTVQRRDMSCSEIAGIEADVPARFQNMFGRETRYRLLARARAGRSGDLVVAECVRGVGSMEEVKRELENICGLGSRAALP